ncbi:MAG: hypothetical protein M1834_001509 [Cirrosporium novae-zelandiae]|nr:MAG: hypothetical protein M1834_004026 [Cirrosporium novae-zelandiae]KAI9735494.1 MAG: hypothetical protein M1834_001509 [Cirrosporium novae-zelandiae]
MPSTDTPTAPDLEIFGSQVTIHPPGFTEKPHDDSSERSLVDGARFRQSPFEFLRDVSLYVSGTGWRAYENVVGQPIFYAGYSERMKNMVMATPMLKEKIQYLAERRVETEGNSGMLGPKNSGFEKKRDKRKREIEQSLQELVEKMTDDMICKMESKAFIRSAFYMCTQLLCRAYHQGIHVNSEEILRLRAVAEQAAKTKTSIVFLPSHRSHVDYVSLQIIMYRLGIGLPVVVAGDNLRFPLVGPFLQHAGAMWIRRSFGNDALYHTLVQSYVDTILQNGYNIECFIEGGRSRTGKLLGPKFGIIGFILDSVLSGRVNDVYFCPVSTQYDKVIEVDGYVNELLGQPKQKENLRDFLSASSVLSLKLGRVDVRFHEPWSLKSFIDREQQRMSNNPQKATKSRADPSGTRLLTTLGYRVLADINSVAVVMPTALVGTVLLTLRGRGVGRSELDRRVDWLSERIKSKGGRVAHFGGLPTDAVVTRAIEVLGPSLVGRIPDLAEETFYAVDRFQLSFYRNACIHLFVSEAVVSTALYTKVKQGGPNQEMSYEALYDQSYFLSQLLRNEFIFPSAGLAANLENTLKGLERDKVVKLNYDHNGAIGSVDLSDEERARGRENYDFYCFLVWPFIEASWLGTVSLFTLTPPTPEDAEKWLDNKTVQATSQLLGKTLYHQGDVSYFEAVNSETLKNAYQRFIEESMVIVAQAKTIKAPTTIKLASEWIPKRGEDGRIIAEGKLWDFTERIAQSRREGLASKNRRDGATVSSRVLRLADRVGRHLFAEAATSPIEEKPVPSPPQKRRRKALQTQSRL